MGRCPFGARIGNGGGEGEVFVWAGFPRAAAWAALPWADASLPLWGAGWEGRGEGEVFVWAAFPRAATSAALPWANESLPLWGEGWERKGEKGGFCLGGV